MPSDQFRARISQMSDRELDEFKAEPALTAAERAVVEDELRAREEGALVGTDAAPISVVVRDFDMPFWNMLAFMVKFVVASLPALIILLSATILIGGLLIGFLREFR